MQDRQRTSLMYFEHFFFQKHWFVLTVCTGNTAMRLFSDLELSKRGETDCISATEHNYDYYGPFPHSCTQRHQPEARVDKIQWFVRNCPSEPRPHLFKSANHLHGYFGGKWYWYFFLAPKTGTGLSCTIYKIPVKFSLSLDMKSGTSNLNKWYRKISVVSVKTGKGNSSEGITFFRKISTGMNRFIEFSLEFPCFFLQMVSALRLLTGA